MTYGIRTLRFERGPQHVTFSEVADHLFDYVERHPHDAVTIDRLARFLAEVEHWPHDHDADPDRGLQAPMPEPAQMFG